MLVALRQNGRVDFYKNFMLIEEHFDKEEPIVDIETGRNFFCLKKKISSKKKQQIIFYDGYK